MPTSNRQIVDLLGRDADSLLSYTAKGFKREIAAPARRRFRRSGSLHHRSLAERAAEFQP